MSRPQFRSWCRTSRRDCNAWCIAAWKRILNSVFTLHPIWHLHSKPCRNRVVSQRSPRAERQLNAGEVKHCSRLAWSRFWPLRPRPTS